MSNLNENVTKVVDYEFHCHENRRVVRVDKKYNFDGIFEKGCVAL